MFTKTLIALVAGLIVLQSCTSIRGRKIAKDWPPYFPSENIFVKWGTDKLAVMKAADKEGMIFESFKASGDTTFIRYTLWLEGWGLLLVRFGLIGNQYQLFVWEGYASDRFDRLVRYADRIDSRNRLLFRTEQGYNAVEIINDGLLYTPEPSSTE